MSHHRLPSTIFAFLLLVSLALMLHVALATPAQTIPGHTSPAPTTEFPKYPTGCQGEFMHRCICGKYTYDGKDKTVTNCTNSGFTDSESLKVLMQISPDTEVLIFTGNSLSTLPQNMFGTETTYEHLNVVDLSNNGIKIIQGQAFHRIPFVEKLILNDNNISLDGKHPRLFANVVHLKELHARGAFDKDLVMHSLPMIFDSGLSNLAVLDLSLNGIGPGINKERLCAFPHLKMLNLSGNALMHLAWNTTCLPKLLKLDLSHNHIPYLEEDTMADMDTVPGLTVNLERNPFQCDCNMVGFYRWLHETNVHVTHKDGFSCYDGYPDNNTKAVLLSLSEEDLQCQEAVSYVAPHFGFLHVVLLIVVLVLVLILVAFAVYNRKRIAKAARVTFSPVTRRMQYSAIKKDTETREVEL